MNSEFDWKPVTDGTFGVMCGCWHVEMGTVIGGLRKACESWFGIIKAKEKESVLKKDKLPGDGKGLIFYFFAIFLRWKATKPLRCEIQNSDAD